MKTLLRRLAAAVALLAAGPGTALLAAPPTAVSITAPAAGSLGTLSSPSGSVTLTATATPSTGAFITQIDFRVNGTSVGIATSSPFSVTWTPTAPGTFNLTAIATDSSSASNNTLQSATVTVTISGVRSAAVALPNANSTVTQNSQLVLRATASASDTVLRGVEFFLGGTSLGSEVTSAPYFQVPTITAAPGTYNLVARATASDGVSTWESTATYPINVVAQPGQPPTVAFVAPATTDVIAVGGSVTLVATASDPDGFIPNTAPGGVSFYADGELIGNDLTAPYSVNWTPTVAKSVTLVAVATDDKGNSRSVSRSVTVLAVAPTVAITAPANNSNATVGTAVTLTANATAGVGSTLANVQFLADGVAIGAADTTAPYSVSWTPSAAGTVALTARVTDSNGTAVTSNPVSVNVAAVSGGPTVSLTAPAAGRIISVGSRLTLTSTATAVGGATISAVEYLNGSTVIASSSTGATYSADWVPTGPGNFSLTARATDSNGLTGVSSPAVSISVVAAPTTTISSSATGAIPSGTAVTLNATATTGSAGSITVTQVEFLANGTVIGTDTTSPYSISWTPPSLGSPFNVTSRVTDSAGSVANSGNSINLSIQSASSNVSVSLAPAGPLSIPSGGARVLTATPNPSTGIDRVEFLLDDAVFATDNSAPYTTVFIATGLGVRTLTARVVDVNGNSATSTGVTVTVTSPVGTAPVTGILTPASGAFVGLGAATTITGTATDADGSITGVQVFVNGQALASATLSGSLWSVPWTPATPGVASIVAVSTDNAGNASASPAVGVNVTDATSPSISLSLSPGPAQPAIATLPSGAIRNLVATASASTGRAIARVEFFVDGTKVGEDTSAPYTFRYVAPPLGDGQQSRQFTVMARATDNAGAARDAIQSVLVVQPIGQGPTVNLLTPATGASVFPNTSVSLAATASATGGTISSVQFYVNGSPAFVNNGNAIANPPYTATFTPTAPGTYTIDAVATDDRGNTASSNSATITAAFATPTVAITSPNPNVTARATPGVPLNLAATAVVQAGGGASVLLVEFLLDGQQIGADTSAPYTFSWTPTVAQIGQRVLTARVTDTNAQTSVSAPVTINVATVVGNAPTITITQPSNGGGVGQAGNLQSLSTVNFVANASSPSTGVTISSVEFFLNDVSIGAAVREQTTNLYRLAYDLSRFDFSSAPSAIDPNTGGTRFTPVPLYAIARDSNNNQTVSNTVNLTVNPATSQPPTVQIQNLSGTTTITQGQQLFIGVASADSDGTVTQVQLFANGTLVSNTNNPQPGQVITYNANTAGRFNLYAVAIDDTGNTTVATPAIVLNVTAVSAPATTLTRPGDDNTATTVGAPVFLEGTAVNNDSTQVPTLQFVATAANGARQLINGIRVGTTTTYRAIWTPTTPSTFTLSTQATVGTAQGTSSNSRRVVVTNVQGLAPTVTISVPTTATTASTANFTANATDSDGSVVSVEFFLNRNSIGFATRDDLANTWRLTAAFAGLQLGGNEVVALARDSSGNVASSPTTNINVTAASSIAPSIAIEPSTTNAAFNRQVQLRANARDTDGTVTSVQYFANGTSLGASNNSGTRYQVNWTPNQSGTFNVWAVATDNSGITRVAETVRISVRRNNPIQEDAAFILQTYSDIANTTNINALVFDDLDAQLAAGSLTRAELAARLTVEPGFSAPVQLLATYYVLMGQWPTPANYNALIGTARGSLSNAVGNILSSAEYFAKYGVVPTAGLLNSPTSAIPADTFIARLWQAAGLGSPTALDNQRFRSNNVLSATLGRGYNVGAVGLNGAIAEFVVNTNSQNTALYNRARAAALFYQLARPQIGVTVEQIAEKVNALLALPDLTAMADAVLKDTLYRYRYVTIVRHPDSLVLAQRSGAIFTVEADGAPPLAYQWLLNGAPIAGATGSTLSLTNVDATRVGTYTVVVTSSAATATSDPATLTLTTTPTRLANISTRGVTTGGANVMIGGFVVTGANANQTRQMLIRVIGPRLGQAPFNVTGFMADPRLEVYARGVANPILTNDNWNTQAGGAAQVTAIQQAIQRAGAFPLQQGSADAVVLATMPPGLYTVMAHPPANNPNASGVVLIEVYDVTQGGPAAPKAANVSTRGQVGTGNNVMIAGFVVNGAATRRMLIRGAGPTLGTLGVPGVLADPQLTLINQETGQTIRSNDNWGSGEDAPIIAAAASAAGAFPFASGSRDAAMIVMLPPGAYTVQLSGVANTTGVGIVEVYDVDP